jgi:hypothetical protein
MSLTTTIARLERRLKARPPARQVDFTEYRDNPAGYAQAALGVTLTPEIKESLEALITPPYKVSVDSGHGVGKTFGAAVAVNWWYDTRPDSVVISTAPTHRDVIDLLWTEVRILRQRAKHRHRGLSLDLMPAAPEMRSGPEHYAKGFTARDANSFVGRHRKNQLFIFDEKEGVSGQFWDGLKSMLRPGAGDAALVIGNPTTTTSRAYFEHKLTDVAGNPAWRRVRISCLDHPNIKAYLAGEAPPIPGAVTGEQVEAWLADWCDPVPQGDERPGLDIEWKGRWYRPGPIGEPRILGLRPSAGTFGVWSEALWQLTHGPEPAVPIDVLPTIGCDVANYGDDYTTFHVRCGAVSLFHQAANGWDHLRIAHRLRELAAEYAEWQSDRHPPETAPCDPKTIQVNLEDDATGRAVATLLARDGYRVVAVNAASTPKRPDLYRNVRSEAWFECRNKAFAGLVNLGRIDKAALQRLEQQAMAPEWAPDAAGRREVERKDQTKEKLGRSPDDADGMNLAYRDALSFQCPTGVTAPATKPPAREAGRDDGRRRRKLWGR